MKFELEQIAQWCGAGITVGHAEQGHGPATGYSIDTRTLAPGDLFFAIRGDVYDAHDFVPAALKKGARAAVVAKAHLTRMLIEAHQHTLLVVDDPLVAMQTLATAVRRHWGQARRRRDRQRREDDDEGSHRYGAERKVSRVAVARESE